MIEYINFILLATLIASICVAYLKLKRAKKYIPLIKMEETAIDSLIRYEFQQEQEFPKKQKSLECVLTGNKKLDLGKIYAEEQINKLNTEEVEKLFCI